MYAFRSGLNINYLKSGFWNIVRWDNGVTEQGSSGGPLFDQNKQLVGTLTGGAANCITPTNDYFEKFALAWDYRKETSKQLKCWLDPQNLNVEKLDGMSQYPEKPLCDSYANFTDNDIHAAIQITSGLTRKGYWSGSNMAGITDFAEKYTFSKSCEIQGVSLGIAKKKMNPINPNSIIEIQVYEGKDTPEKWLYSEKFEINKFYNDAMNYLLFKEPVKTTGNFFVTYNISQMYEGDTLAVYMAKRETDTTNSFYLKNQDGWSAYTSKSLNGNGSALLMELVACNIDDTTSIHVFNTEARFFPNPLNGGSDLIVETVNQIKYSEDIAVYDLLGKRQDVPISSKGTNRLMLNFSGKRPGIYLIRLEAGGHSIVGKISYIP